MFKHRADRLNLLARLAALKTQSNLADLQVRQQLLQKQQSACLQLQSYQDEYFKNQPSDESRQAAVNVSILQNNSRFMADLNYAVRVQQQQLTTAQQVASDSRSVWSRSYAKEQRWKELEKIARREQQLKQDKKYDQENLNIWSARHSCKDDNKL
tara:strand:+ start:4587 stop:5051 length:465 start_codon:yes stop_codon:yes gene_type:complete